MSKVTVPVEFLPEPFPLTWKYHSCRCPLQPDQAESGALGQNTFFKMH